eukprot:12297894-Alexandrium_andersonii.AAC.2
MLAFLPLNANISLPMSSHGCQVSTTGSREPPQLTPLGCSAEGGWAHKHSLEQETTSAGLQC